MKKEINHNIITFEEAVNKVTVTEETSTAMVAKIMNSNMTPLQVIVKGIRKEEKKNVNNEMEVI
jgi:hypothetical protein